jgi:hypothetical protein
MASCVISVLPTDLSDSASSGCSPPNLLEVDQEEEEEEEDVERGEWRGDIAEWCTREVFDVECDVISAAPRCADANAPA